MSNLSRKERRAKERKIKKDEKRLRKMKTSSKKYIYFTSAAVLTAGLVGGGVLFSHNHIPVKNRPATESIKVKQEKSEILSGIGYSKNISLTITDDKLYVLNRGEDYTYELNIEKKFSVGGIDFFIIKSDKTSQSAFSTTFEPIDPNPGCQAVTFMTETADKHKKSIVLDLPYKYKLTGGLGKSNVANNPNALQIFSIVGEGSLTSTLHFIEEDRIGKLKQKQIRNTLLNGTKEEKPALIDELIVMDAVSDYAKETSREYEIPLKELLKIDLLIIWAFSKLDTYDPVERAFLDSQTIIVHELTHAMLNEYIHDESDNSIDLQEHLAHLASVAYSPNIFVGLLFELGEELVLPSDCGYTYNRLILFDEFDDLLDISGTTENELKELAKKLLNELSKEKLGKNFEELVDVSLYEKAIEAYGNS